MCKVITICGSLKFKNQIMEKAEELELNGNCVLSVIYPTRDDKDNYNEEELEMLSKMHNKKIALSDAIYVVDVKGYIGKKTREEIEYAKFLGKEIIYYSNSN
jgi:hypothetical protein